MRRSKFGVVLFACLSLYLPRMAPLRGDDVSESSSGAVRLPSSVLARYEYHFDRNSLRDSRRQGDALIALSASGNLLRFDLNTRRLTGQRFDRSMIVCLGRGEGDEVLAGFEDGRVSRVDPATLDLTEIAKVPGRPRWVESPAGGKRSPRNLIAVIEQAKSSLVQDIASGKSYEVEPGATAFFLDSKRRLWIGEDRGEWGGSCSYVDLSSGKRQSIAGIKRRNEEAGEGWDGVYGFIELRDGQVWAYGGVSHMGFNEAFIRRVDKGKAEELLRSDNSAAIKARMERRNTPKPDRPKLPITHMIEGRDGSLLVFAYSDIFRTDTKLNRWTKLHELDIQYRWGRPDAVGSYPSVSAVHLFGRKGRESPLRHSPGWLCACQRRQSKKPHSARTTGSRQHHADRDN